MKKILYVALFILFLTGCGGGNPFDEVIENSTRIEISLYSKGKVVLTIEDKEQIKAFAKYIMPKYTKEYKCGYDGKVVFDTPGKKYEAEFNLSDDCKQIVCVIDDELISRKLTPEGLEFLRDLDK